MAAARAPSLLCLLLSFGVAISRLDVTIEDLAQVLHKRWDCAIIDLVPVVHVPNSFRTIAF